ncbi:phage tail protein [Serratia sp. Leaf50]|nr:phage tail protein [Serratia sp. Leaf50]
MPTNYLTREGDVLDAICFKHYGAVNVSQTLVAVLDANPGLSELDAVYLAGISIHLPILDLPLASSAIQLWD